MTRKRAPTTWEKGADGDPQASLERQVPDCLVQRIRQENIYKALEKHCRSILHTIIKILLLTHSTNIIIPMLPNTVNLDEN